METAQDRFKNMLKTEVAPALRELGFNGSGQAFYLPSDDYWIIVGFQKSAFSDSSSLKFTINVTVGSKSTWEDARKERSDLPERPKPNTFVGEFIWQRRIGKLLPSGQDTWWTLGMDADERQLSREVLDAIRDYALPSIRQQLESSN